MTQRLRQVDAPDYGPLVRVGKHRVPVLVARGEAEVEDGADPLHPNRTVLRVRRVPHYDAWHRRGGITDGMREACDRYAITCEHEAGARDRGAPGMPRGGRRDWHPLMTAVQASASLRAAHEAVGHDGAALLRLYVRDNTPIEEIARRRRERDAKTRALVRGSLEALAKHWGVE